MNQKGKCYLVATPIGNLEDISYRAVRILQEADRIACEDTRNTIKLLNHYNIKSKMISYHQHNEKMRSEYLCQLIEEGESIAIVSDAGMPGISDPGVTMVQACIERNIPVEVIPGASASISALVLSGLDTTNFYFKGFLSTNKKTRREELAKLRFLECTLIFYEGPHKLLGTLGDLQEHLGDRRISIARELTKLHQEVIHGHISRAIEHFRQKEPRGEFVLVVEGHIPEVEEQNWANISLEEHFEFYIDKGIDRKEVIKLIAKDRQIPKREVYEQLMKK